MQKTYLLAGAIVAGLAVALGAFGAHGLKKIVSAETLAIFHTAVQYQFYHAIALILAGILFAKAQNGFVNYAGVLFIAGIVLFSGSLYFIVSQQATGRVVPTAIALLTPVGGLCFIIGWLLLVIGIAKI